MSELDKKNTPHGALTDPELGSGTSLAAVMHTGLGLESPFMREIFLKRQVIVGTRFQGGSDELVEDLKKESRITFLREPDNEFDSNAIMALDAQGRKLGYIPRRENEMMSALMDAGKYFYGIITESPEINEYSERRTPFSIWMDLYMREFAGPEDLREIPPQGYRGSYVVVDFTFAGTKDRMLLTGFYAIRYIHGEERASLQKNISDSVSPEGDIDRTEQEGMIREFADFVGRLPIVSFGILGSKQLCLEETHDIILGTTFSNRIIDTLQMAENHLPQIASDNLMDYADYLGIIVHCSNSLEERCRIIWKLYYRMERSELDVKKPLINKAILREKSDDTDGGRDILISDLGMTERTRNILYKNNIDTVRELIMYSEDEVRSFENIDDRTLGEIKGILSDLKLDYRPKGTDSFLYIYPDHVKKPVENRKGGWEYLFFMELVKVRYQWLQPLRKRKMEPGRVPLTRSRIEGLTELKDMIVSNLDIITGYFDEISQVLNVELQEAVGEPGHEGDAGKIYLSVDHLMNTYKKALRWADDFRATDVIPKYREVIEIFARSAEPICSFYDLLYDRCIRGIESFNDYFDGYITKEEIVVDMSFNLEYPKELSQELVEWFRKN